MVDRYAYTFLFACPDCDLPVAVSRIREKNNLKVLDEESIHIKCSYCGKFSNVIAFTAKKHWVDDWPANSNGEQPNAVA